ncbi:hypothetical protein HPC49_18285 [Pyxidicoccus fallax]|uniref:Uncharacterized protein n=1 Tax=Pyxidicoccus fallax TaxID=394095 RepID=A0A848LKC1_9BACT|nr:hypothetical protein [Pyxidicoccus fallax]NMO18215.1 hypothetical protein [Pyxidicoccus fallax]NPC80159.1 hypothetical protein [Pyxidicoccus fallax]
MKRFLMPLRRGVLVVGVLLGAGAAVSAPREDAINLRIARQQYNLVMTPEAVTGADFQISRSPGELRGRTYLGNFTLEVKDGQVKGALGGAAVNLKVSKEGDAIIAKGGFGGRPVNFKLNPSELEVYVRDCTYRLKAQEPQRYYVGKRSCDVSATPPSEVWLPDEFQAASPEEKAVILLLAL